MKLFSVLSSHRFWGAQPSTVSHLEKWVSTLGAFIGIYLVYLISRQFISFESTMLVVASMGATAVLLFAVPHGALSQPWPLVGGHLVSAIVGVTCARYISDPFVAGAAAVSLAICGMHYLRCIHPPGGATALTAVAAGPALHSLGYAYVLMPVMLNVAVMLAVALSFNYLFHWRRYPVGWARSAEDEPVEEPAEVEGEMVTQDDLLWALRSINSYIDVAEEDLGRIYARAMRHHAEARHLKAEQVQVGHCYSNGEYGPHWSVRQVVSGHDGEGRPDEEIGYVVVAGDGRQEDGRCTREAFAHWARYEVYRNENSWQKIGALSAA